MRKDLANILTILLICGLSLSCSSGEKTVRKNDNSLPTKTKQVALTFDDLPFAVNNEFISEEEKKKLFTHTLDVLKKYNIKITGFLIGARYDSSWYPYIKRFLMEGHTLGNHTFSHYNSNEHSAEEYIDNISRCDSLLRVIVKSVEKDLNLPLTSLPIKRNGVNDEKELIYPPLTVQNREEIKKILMADKENFDKINEIPLNRNWKYFRYPYLNRGETERKKFTIIAALENMGYKIAPVTITSNDWRFNPRFEVAYLNNLESEEKEIAHLYLSRIKRELYNSEDYSLVTFHRNVKHIMLFHLNVINSYLLEDILKLLIRSGYEFIDLDEALTDDIYQMADGYSGSYGVPWLYRAKKIRTIKQ